MLEIFSCRQWRNDPLQFRTFHLQDGYGEYLAYPHSGSLSKEQFEQFQEITRLAKQTYPAIFDKLLNSSVRLLRFLANVFEIQQFHQVHLSARTHWVQYKLNRANCPVQVFFLPKTLYDIITTHEIEDPTFWHTKLGILSEQSIVWPFISNRLPPIDEHKISEELFRDVSMDLAFRVNQRVIKQLDYRKQKPLLPISEMTDWAISAFQTSPWYQQKWQPILHALDPLNERFQPLLDKTLQLECSVHSKSTILYRGGKARADSPKKENGSFHSLSYGTSLIAGGIDEHKLESGGSPWVYCMQKENDCIATVISESSENNPFYIPSSSLQMLGRGEFFHARTKMPEKVPDYKMNEYSTPGYLASLPFEIYSYPRNDFIRFHGSPEALLAAWKPYHDKAVFLVSPNGC